MSDEEDTKKVIPDQEIHQLQPHCHRKKFALPIFFVAGTAENLWQILPGCSLYSDTGAFWRENNSLCDQPVKTWDRNLRSREMFCHFFIPHVCCSFLILIVNKQMDNNFDTPCVNGSNTSGLFWPSLKIYQSEFQPGQTDHIVPCLVIPTRWWLNHAFEKNGVKLDHFPR